MKGIPFVNERYTKGVFPSKMVYNMVRGLTPESTRIKHPHPHSRGSPSDHFRNRLALVTTAFVKTLLKFDLNVLMKSHEAANAGEYLTEDGV